MSLSYSTNAENGYMGNPKRGAPLGRGSKNPAEAIETTRTIIKATQSAVDYFADHIAKGEIPSHLDSMDETKRLHAVRSEELLREQTTLARLEQAAQKPLKVTLRRIRLDMGGYDPTGAYFGHGVPLYWAASESGLDMTFRAKDRGDAKRHVLKEFPKAKFYR